MSVIQIEDTRIGISAVGRYSLFGVFLNEFNNGRGIVFYPPMTIDTRCTSSSHLETNVLIIIDSLVERARIAV